MHHSFDCRATEARTLISEGIWGTRAVVAGAGVGAAAAAELAAGAALEGMATVRVEGGADAAALPKPKDMAAGAELAATAGAEEAAARAPTADSSHCRKL